MLISLKRKLIAVLLVSTVAVGVAVSSALAEDHADSLFARIRTVYNLVQAYHKDGADLDKFINGAIKGGLEALGDPNTNYFSPTDYQGFLDSLNGTFSGIGAYLELDGNYIVIAAPIKNTPAEKAGLKSGDRLLEADGVSLAGQPVERAVRVIRGPAGTAVVLKIERPSEGRTFTVSVTRATITIPQVEYKMLEGKIGYIQLSSFGDTAVSEFYKATADLKRQGAVGLVLDLRQNPGGYLEAAVDIASAFVPAGEVVVWEVGKNGKQARRSSGQLINLPTSVLIDKGSASASEIVAGAIQDYGSGTLVGVTSFGKGTVQQILSMSGGGGIKITIEEYFTPKERKVHGAGLTPDVVVENIKPTDQFKPLEPVRFLGIGSIGLDVLYLQQRLEQLGYHPDTDGFFGGKTEQAILKFAKENNLPEDSLVDMRHIDIINAKLAALSKPDQPVDTQLNRAVELVQQKLR